MGKRLSYEPAPDVEALARKIAEEASLRLDFSRIHFVRSRGAKTRAYARVHGFPRVLQFALNMPAHYVVEVIAESFDPLPLKQKVEVLAHELLHIPPSMGGGLRDHRYVTRKRVKAIVSRLSLRFSYY